jgi:site-specific recombinase XerD
VSISTRKQRLAAIHALARFIAENSPQHVARAGEVRTIPCKKTVRELVSYLDKHKVEALLATPDRTTAHRQRHYALLLFLYNSGARASQAANLCIADLELDTRQPLTASVPSWGKVGRCDDAHSGKRPRWNWSNSSRIDRRNRASS